MIIATIDMGTNTFHILVANVSNGKFDILHKEKRSVKIGQGGISKGIITESAQKRALDTLIYFKEVIDKYKVAQVFATATSAIRSASNGKELTAKIKSETGIEVRIISGDLEAQFIYNAVKKAVDIGEDISVIMDVGGGSVEFIICDAHQIFWKKSFEIGGQRLLDLYDYHNPILPKEIDDLQQYIASNLEELTAVCQKYKPKTLIGSSGTFDTLINIYDAKENLLHNEKQTEFSLSLPAFTNIYNEIIQKNRTERLKINGMVEMRVDMIVVALILVKFVIDNNDLQKIKISSLSLKEGVLYDILEGL